MQNILSNIVHCLIFICQLLELDMRSHNVHVSLCKANISRSFLKIAESSISVQILQTEGKSR